MRQISISETESDFHGRRLKRMDNSLEIAGKMIYAYAMEEIRFRNLENQAL